MQSAAQVVITQIEGDKSQQALVSEQTPESVGNPSSTSPPLSDLREKLPRGQYALAESAYRKEHFLNLSPVEVIRKLYDTAIIGCKKNDTALAQQAVTELIIGLNFECEDISVGLYRLYQYSKDCIRKGELDEAVNVLQELRATWVEAFHL